MFLQTSLLMMDYPVALDGSVCCAENQHGQQPIQQSTEQQTTDAIWMAEALRLAAQGLGRTAPNPAVGCILVKGGVAIGRGFHRRAGEPHAEVEAIRGASAATRGATAYVTLEPCNHYGRTPPCSEALIQAGVTRVVIAALDPNPKVAGAGVRRLREAGIDVVWGVLEAEALRQQAGFRSLITRQRPWLIYKTAMTLDGNIATMTGHSQWVSGSQARSLVQQWRNQVDGIAVGRGTVVADNPRLTTRGVAGGRDARAVIFDRQARIPKTAQVVREGTILVTSSEANTDEFEAQGMTVVRADSAVAGLKALGTFNLATVMLEGGPTLAGSLLTAGLIDEMRVFIAPKILGAGHAPFAAPQHKLMTAAKALQDVHAKGVGDDLLVTGFLHPIARIDEPL